jgi:hypothetical protein
VRGKEDNAEQPASQSEYKHTTTFPPLVLTFLSLRVCVVLLNDFSYLRALLHSPCRALLIRPQL